MLFQVTMLSCSIPKFVDTPMQSVWVASFLLKGLHYSWCNLRSGKTCWPSVTLLKNLCQVKSFLERVQWKTVVEIPPDLDPRIHCPWSKGALQSERLHVGLEREHRRLGGGRWSCEAGCWCCASGGGVEVEVGAGFLREYTEVLKKEGRSVGLKGFWERGGWSFTTTTWNYLGRGLKAQSKSQH